MKTKIFKLAIRPFIIFCVVVGVIIIVGSCFKTLSSDEINGYVNAMIVSMLINYCNLSCIQYKEDRNK